MSQTARWSYTQLVTVWWPGEKDDFGRFQWSAPEQVMCLCEQGGADEYVDSTGQKFVPKSTYWTEMHAASGVVVRDIEIGCKIQLGEVFGDPTSEADDVRVAAKSYAPWEPESPDFEVMT